MKKYNYFRIIQQNYGQGYEDASEYECNSKGITSEMSGKFKESKSGRLVELSLLAHDLAEYRCLGYPTRVITRRVKAGEGV